MATLNGLPANIAGPHNRHDYNGIARVDPLADRANVKIAYSDWLANTVAPAVANATPITNITNADPGVVTSAGHGLSNGNEITIMGVDGMEDRVNGGHGLNEQWFTVANVTANTFTITNTSAFTAYVSGGSFFVNPTAFAYTGLAYV